MALVYIVIAVVVAAFGGRAVSGPYVDGDLFWQKHLGSYVLAHHALPASLGNESFAAAGAPWVPQEWLLGIAAAIAVDHNALWVLAVLAALAVGAALLASAARANRFGAPEAATFICSIFVAVDVEGSFGIRAQVFAWPLFTGLLLLLDLTGSAVFWILPLIVVWANLHASVFIAVPVVWIDTLASMYLRGGRDPDTRRRFILSILAPLATLATPLGIKLPLYAVMVSTSPVLRRLIDEWRPVGWGHHFFWYGAIPMLVMVLLCARKTLRERPRDAALITLLTIATFGAVRNAPLLGFALMPVAASSLDALLDRFAFWRAGLLRSPGPRRLLVYGGAIVAALVFVVGARGVPGATPWRPALDAFGKLAAMPGEQRLFCYDFAVCSPALDFPRLRIFMDGRADPYPPQVWLDFDTLRTARPGWEAIVTRYGVNAAYVKRKDKLDKALSARPDWTLVRSSETCCRLYVRHMDLEPWAGKRSVRTPF
jgi:hypothetical protein